MQLRYSVYGLSLFGFLLIPAFASATQESTPLLKVVPITISAEVYRLVQSTPKDYVERAVQRAEARNYSGAIEDTNQALKINPSYARAYNVRGTIRSDMGNASGAIEDYNRALKIDPHYANVYYNRGRSRAALGDRQGAVQDFQKAASLYLEQGKIDDYKDAVAAIQELKTQQQTVRMCTGSGNTMLCF